MSKDEKLAAILTSILFIIYLIVSIYLNDDVVSYQDIMDLPVEERIRYEQRIW